MKSVMRLLSVVGLVVAGTLAASAPAFADHGGVSVSLYGGGRHHGYAVQLDNRDYGYRPGYNGYRNNGYRNERYVSTYAQGGGNGPWCPTHGQYHNHSYGYYGFNGGYYGVSDGGSYEEVFARAYDDGYSDGFNALGSRLEGGTRPYRRGYAQGYRDGRRDSRNAGVRYGYR